MLAKFGVACSIIGVIVSFAIGNWLAMLWALNSGLWAFDVYLSEK